MPLSRELALSSGELEELMTTSWNMRIATVGPGSRINVTPLWFAWVDGRVYAYCRGQKIANLRRNPVATVLVDRNEKFPELVGAMFQGRAEVLEDAAAEAADPALARAQEQIATKYRGGHGEPRGEALPRSTARGRSMRWIRFTPNRLVSWDNHKLGLLRRG
jgi:nitroimidazol reductase NimA-like FMN-containing flavoprotein (pyridoxamine 5'-phosphate oxidase superfamily)